MAAHQDMLTTFLAAAGDPDIAQKCRAGHTIDDVTYKVILDGEDLGEYLAGDVAESPRHRFFYVNDDAQLVALRIDDWKFVFLEQRAKQLAIWIEPFVELRAPRIFNLRRDPFERAVDQSNTYFDWFMDRIYLVVPAQMEVAKAVQEFAEFPPRQKPASFNLDRILEQLEKMQAASG